MTDPNTIFIMAGVVIMAAYCKAERWGRIRKNYKSDCLVLKIKWKVGINASTFGLCLISFFDLACWNLCPITVVSFCEIEIACQVFMSFLCLFVVLFLFIYFEWFADVLKLMVGSCTLVFNADVWWNISKYCL